MFQTGMHTPDAEDGSYTGDQIAFCYARIDSRYLLSESLNVIFCTGANDHLYTIYDPRDDSEEDWDYWNIICRVLFCLRNYLKPHTHMITSDSNRANRHSRKSGCSWVSNGTWLPDWVYQWWVWRPRKTQVREVCLFKNGWIFWKFPKGGSFPI